MRYDSGYVEEVTLKDGRWVRLRTVQPTDKEMLRAAIAHLSSESRYLRFFTDKPRLTDGELRYLTEFDGVHHYAIGAETMDGATGLGYARLIALVDEPTTAELAVVVADELHGRGLGTTLMRRLLEAACERGIRRVYTEVLATNLPMRRLMEHLNLELVAHRDGTVVTLEAPTPCEDSSD